MVPLVFDFLTTHDLPAFRCLPPRAAAMHLIGGADDDFLRVARRSKAREDALFRKWEDATASEGDALGARATTVALHSNALEISRQIRIAGWR